MSTLSTVGAGSPTPAASISVNVLDGDLGTSVGVRVASVTLFTTTTNLSVGHDN